MKRKVLALIAVFWISYLASCARHAEPVQTAATPPASNSPLAIAQPPANPTATRPQSSTLSPTSPAPSPTLPSPSSPTPQPLPSPTPCAEPGQIITRTYPSPVAGSDQDVRIYLPPCYGAAGYTYPTLYLFAGNVHDEGKWDELGVDEAAETAIAAGRVPPLLIVMPDGGRMANNTSGGPGSYESVILEDLIPWVEEEYCAWPAAAGRAIGGLSRGGYWALEIAFRFPEQFAAVGGHSAALLDEYAGPEINPQQTALSRDLGALRIYLDIGADDYLRTNTIRLHQEMEAYGVPHTWILQEGRHEDAYWAAHVGDYLQWYGQMWPAERSSYPPCEQE